MSEKEFRFLEHLKSELSLTSPWEAVPLIISVLQAVRQMLSRQNAEALLARLPDFFRGYFTFNWFNEEKQVRVEHLDELVTLVMERDGRNDRKLFKSELQTLSVILLTLKKAFEKINPTSVDGIGQPFYQEFSEAAAEIT